MKKTLLTAAIALTGLAAFSNANATGYTPGDALLNFTKQGNANDIAIDLGNLSGPYGSFASFNLSSSALSAVLDATYGAGWSTASTVSWSLIGSPQANFVDLTSYSLTIGNTGAYTALTDFGTVATVGNYADAIASASGNGGSSTGTIADSLGHSHWYTIYANVVGGSAQGVSGADAAGFGAFSGALSGAITTYTSNAIVNYTTADDGTGNGIIASTATTGSFSVSGGQINVVPEPATYALFGLGALLLVIAVRRKSQNA